MSDLQQNGLWTLAVAVVWFLNARFILPLWARWGLLLPRRMLTPESIHAIQVFAYAIGVLLVGLGAWNVVTG